MEEIIDIVNFEIQNSGYADKLAAGMVITGRSNAETSLS
jgi:hypothetical protein